MQDVLFLTTAIVFALSSWLLVVVADKLMGEKP